jgi:hypothetical protein
VKTSLLEQTLAIKAARAKKAALEAQIAADGATKTAPIETHAKTPTKEAKVEAADQSQLTTQDRKVVPVRVVGGALFIKFEEIEGETEMALGGAAGAAAEARVAGCGHKATAAALGPAIHAHSTSAGIDHAHFVIE